MKGIGRGRGWILKAGENHVGSAVPTLLDLVVRVTHVIDPRNFTAQIGSRASLEYFTQFEDRLQDWCDENQTAGTYEWAYEGCLICISSHRTDRWHRASVLALDGDEVDTYLLDYGFSEKVPLDHVISSRLMPHEFSVEALPAQAFMCSLANVTPLTDSEEYSAEAIGRFRELVEGVVLWGKMESQCHGVKSMGLSQTQNGLNQIAAVLANAGLVSMGLDNAHHSSMQEYRLIDSGQNSAGMDRIDEDENQQDRFNEVTVPSFNKELLHDDNIDRETISSEGETELMKIHLLGAHVSAVDQQEWNKTDLHLGKPTLQRNCDGNMMAVIRSQLDSSLPVYVTEDQPEWTGPTGRLAYHNGKENVKGSNKSATPRSENKSAASQDGRGTGRQRTVQFAAEQTRFEYDEPTGADKHAGKGWAMNWNLDAAGRNRNEVYTGGSSTQLTGKVERYSRAGREVRDTAHELGRGALSQSRSHTDVHDNLPTSNREVPKRSDELVRTRDVGSSDAEDVIVEDDAADYIGNASEQQHKRVSSKDRGQHKGKQSNANPGSHHGQTSINAKSRKSRWKEDDFPMLKTFKSALLPEKQRATSSQPATGAVDWKGAILAQKQPPGGASDSVVASKVEEGTRKEKRKTGASKLQRRAHVPSGDNTQDGSSREASCEPDKGDTEQRMFVISQCVTRVLNTIHADDADLVTFERLRMISARAAGVPVTRLEWVRVCVEEILRKCLVMGFPEANQVFSLLQNFRDEDDLSEIVMKLLVKYQSELIYTKSSSTPRSQRLQRNYCELIGRVFLTAQDWPNTGVPKTIISFMIEKWINFNRWAQKNQMGQMGKRMLYADCLHSVLSHIGLTMERCYAAETQFMFDTIREIVLSEEVLKSIKNKLLDVMLLRASNWAGVDSGVQATCVPTMPDKQHHAGPANALMTSPAVEAYHGGMENGQAVTGQLSTKDAYASVRRMLEQLGLQHLLPVFLENGIRDTLLTAEQKYFTDLLKDCGVPIGAVLEIVRYLENSGSLRSRSEERERAGWLPVGWTTPDPTPPSPEPVRARPAIQRGTTSKVKLVAFGRSSSQEDDAAQTPAADAAATGDAARPPFNYSTAVKNSKAGERVRGARGWYAPSDRDKWASAEIGAVISLESRDASSAARPATAFVGRGPDGDKSDPTRRRRTPVMDRLFAHVTPECSRAGGAPCLSSPQLFDGSGDSSEYLQPPSAFFDPAAQRDVADNANSNPRNSFSELVDFRNVPPPSLPAPTVRRDAARADDHDTPPPDDHYTAGDDDVERVTPVPPPLVVDSETDWFSPTASPRSGRRLTSDNDEGVGSRQLSQLCPTNWFSPCGSPASSDTPLPRDDNDDVIRYEETDAAAAAAAASESLAVTSGREQQRADTGGASQFQDRAGSHEGGERAGDSVAVATLSLKSIATQLKEGKFAAAEEEEEGIAEEEPLAGMEDVDGTSLPAEGNPLEEEDTWETLAVEEPPCPVAAATASVPIDYVEGDVFDSDSDSEVEAPRAPWQPSSRGKPTNEELKEMFSAEQRVCTSCGSKKHIVYQCTERHLMYK